ncbi:dual specificity protein phosphatase family protein [Aggregatilineales bacterium SYSU G02658]
MSLLVEIKRLKDQLRTHGLRLTAMAGVDKFGRKLLGRPIWRYSWITPDILLGGQPARRVWPTLTKIGVKGIINLRDEYDYLDRLARKTDQLHYLYLPTVDNTAPTLEHLAQGVEFMREIFAEGGKVYIHCWEGLGRGPTMVAAYLVSTGLTPDEAWDYIRSVRPFIRPVPAQRAQLQTFAEQYATSQPTTPTEEQH